MATMNQVGVGLSGATGTGSFLGTNSPSVSSPTLITPQLGTPASGNLSNCTNFAWGTNNSTGIQLRFVSGTISAAQILALNATPIAAIAAAGSNTVILVENYAAYYIYNSTPYTAGASQTIAMNYGTGTSPSLVTTLFSNAILTGTNSVASSGKAIQQGSLTVAQAVNVGVYFKNPVATEVTAGNSTFNYYIWYKIIDISTV